MVKIKYSLAGVLGGCALALSPVCAGAVQVVSNIAYNASTGTAGLGNLYLPAGYDADTPVALAIHGGGWSGGDRASWAGVAEYLCKDLGFAVFNIEYRLTGPGQYWPACGNDCLDAANYLLGDAFAQRFGLRCRKVWPCGGSAGGHLALWTGLSLPPEKVGGIISISGIGDLLPDSVVNPSRYVSFFGHAPVEAELVAASPMTRVTSNSPPVFCSHATTDTVVPPACTQHIVDACRAAGVTVEHYTYGQRDTGHSIWIPGSSPHKLFADIEAAIARFVWKLTGAGLVVGQDDFYAGLDVTDDVRFVRPLIDQSVRKTGAGRMTLQNPRMTRAAVEVLQGGVTVAVSDTFAPPELPAALRQKAAFWVDANTNVVADGAGKVSRWHDAREVSVNGPAYQYMMATNAEAARLPALASDAGLGGKKYVDFGSWGPQDSNVNSRWLFWAGTNCVAKTLDLRAAMIVFGSHNGSGGGGICLIQNSASLSPAPTAPFAGAGDRLWLNSANVIADDAVNYLDRQMRDGRNLQISDKAYHLIETLTLQAAKANTFAKDRIYPGYSGGARICEALLFTEELTAAERMQVQDYLWQKWFSRSGESSLGSFRTADASTLEIALGTDGAQAEVAGDGAVGKSGPGTLTLASGTNAFGGTVRLREGSLLVAGEPFLFDLEEGGQTLEAQDPQVKRSAAAAGKVVKTGGGELAVASVAEGVTEIEVAAGTLRLATPRVADAVPMADGNVNEGSLEAFTNGTTAPYVNFTSAPSAPPFTTNGWTFDRSAYASGGFLVGVAFDYPRSGQVMATDLAPDGHAVLYINRGKAETDFAVPASGVYRLEFHAASSATYTNRHVTVSVDGAPVRTLVAQTAAFCRHAIMLPFLAAGTHRLCFTGEGADNGRVAFIDAIRVAPVALCGAAPVLAAVTNASFEGPVELFEAAVVTNAPAGTGWLFGGSAGIGRIQPLNANPRLMPLAVPEGVGAAVLPVTGRIGQDVTFPAAGTYRLTFATAARAGLVNHTFEVALGGAPVGSFVTADTAFRRVELTLPPVEAGVTKEVAFVGTGAANTGSLIDDIRIERVAAAGDIARARRAVAGRFPATTALDLAAGAKLVLDFDGQSRVRAVRYAGQTVSGLIAAATHPEFVSGTGSLSSPGKTTLISVR